MHFPERDDLPAIKAFTWELQPYSCRDRFLFYIGKPDLAIQYGFSNLRDEENHLERIPGNKSAGYSVYKPQAGCMIFFLLAQPGNREDDPPLGWDAFLFDGETWIRPPLPHQVRIQGRGVIGVQVGPDDFFRTDSHDDWHAFLDFWAGHLTIADLITIDQRRRVRPKLIQALDEVRKLKGAVPKVHSRTALTIQFILEDLTR